LIALIRYQAGVLVIRFLRSHEEYDKIDAETDGSPPEKFCCGYINAARLKSDRRTGWSARRDRISMLAGPKNSSEKSPSS